MRDAVKPFLALTVSLFALNVLGPAALVLPVAFCIFHRKLSLFQMTMAALISGIALFFFPQPPPGRYLSLLHHTTACAGFLTFLARIRDPEPDPHRTLLPPIIVTFIVSAVAVALYPMIMGSGLAADMAALLQQEAFQLTQPMQTAMAQLGNLIVGIVATWQMLLLVLNIYLFQRITGTLVGFRNLRLPFVTIAFFIILGICYIFSGILSVLPGWIANPSANLLIAFTALYYLQGLSVAVFFIENLKIPRIARMVCYLILLIQPGPMLVIAVGFAEPWVEFRTRFPIIKS